MPKERAEAILEAGIRHYIDTGEPVTSKALFEECDFGIRPAMIRAELSSLCNDGYFTQNHPSGGRIPTAKAYEFFTRRLMEREKEKETSRPSSTGLRMGKPSSAGLRTGKRPPAFAGNLARELARGELGSFVEEMSRHLALLGVGYAFSSDRFYESGIYELFSSLDIEEKDDVLDVARDIEALRSRIDEGGKWLKEGRWPRVWIGGSPITKSPGLSVIANRISVDRKPFLLLMIGPVRMDYEKSLQFMNALEESLE